MHSNIAPVHINRRQRSGVSSRLGEMQPIIQEQLIWFSLNAPVSLKLSVIIIPT